MRKEIAEQILNLPNLYDETKLRTIYEELVETLQKDDWTPTKESFARLQELETAYRILMIEKKEQVLMEQKTSQSLLQQKEQFLEQITKEMTEEVFNQQSIMQENEALLPYIDLVFSMFNQYNSMIAYITINLNNEETQITPQFLAPIEVGWELFKKSSFENLEAVLWQKYIENNTNNEEEAQLLLDYVLKKYRRKQKFQNFSEVIQSFLENSCLMELEKNIVLGSRQTTNFKSNSKNKSKVELLKERIVVLKSGLKS